MKLTDESGKEYEVVGEGLLGPTCAPYTVFTVRPVPTADEVDRLVEDWDRERPGEIDIKRALGGTP